MVRLLGLDLYGPGARRWRARRGGGCLGTGKRVCVCDAHPDSVKWHSPSGLHTSACGNSLIGQEDRGPCGCFCGSCDDVCDWGHWATGRLVARGLSAAGAVAAAGAVFGCLRVAERFRSLEDRFSD